MISSSLYNSLKQLAKEFDLDYLILFGSRATNKFRDDSDFDIAYFKQNFDLKQHRNFIVSIRNLFDEQQLDLVDLSQDLNPRLLYDICFRNEIIYVKDKWKFEDFKDKVYFYYQDSKQLFEPYKKIYLEA